jgi:erythronate-4-phosphate dehydrogenase
MRIAVDENVPGAHDAFGQFGDVVTFAGRSLTRADLDGIDALVVRSVTRVDASLLDGTAVRFVGTATIGTDHLDHTYLRRRTIAFADAAGSNSRSVAEYVVAALLRLSELRGIDLVGESLGVVGIGRIGSIVASLARALGMSVVQYDPPRAHRDRTFQSARPSELFASRIITLHVPLTVGCDHPTWHLVDAAFLERMRDDAVLINTSRGAVAHRSDLTAALRRRLIASAVLDVWEGEPDLHADLIERVAIATPHIAGYSLDGKVRGTAMIAEAMARFLGVRNEWTPDSIAPRRAGVITIAGDAAPLECAAAAVAASYDITRDDASLRALLGADELQQRSGFDRLRRDYPIRREFGCHAIDGGTPAARELLRELGFRAE